MDFRNIYKIARERSGLTQERWGESIGVTPESVRHYEGGLRLPSDEIVCAMTEVSGLTALGYWHLRNKSRIAADELPEVERLPLPEAVLRLLLAIDDFTGVNGDLIRVAADGRISPDELASWVQIRSRLEDVIRAALQVRYSEGGGGDA